MNSSFNFKTFTKMLFSAVSVLLMSYSFWSDFFKCNFNNFRAFYVLWQEN